MATEPEKVTMADGRLVEFGAKRKLLKTIHFDDKGHPSVRFDLKNGDTFDFKVPHKMLGQLAAHGAAQKIGDSIANVEEVDDCSLTIEKLIEQLNRGEWREVKEGDSMAGTSVLAKALIEFTNQTKEQVREYLAGKDHKQKIALRNLPGVKVIIDRIESQKKSKVTAEDTAALGAELAALAGASVAKAAE